MTDEEKYIRKRLLKAKCQSFLFYLFRIFPIKKNKIVFCTIEGTTGYSCNPKYIAEEFIRRKENYELVWLVNDVTKVFPKEIKVVHNSLWNRAYQLTTAKVWIDNSRKQLEVRKRKNQLYIQTWHAKIGFKPTCLDRGASFSRIAYLVSKHDSDMIDYVLSNSKWYDDSLPTGMLYNGPILRVGSPRCDILVNDKTEMRKEIRKRYHISEDTKIIMYAPTFRGGSQGTNRRIEVNQQFPDYERLRQCLSKRFGGEWVIFLRLHPQLVARNLDQEIKDNSIIDVSRVDDMYELLAACDAFMTDYSSAAFDAAVMKIPVFLYVYDYEKYEEERGGLLWDLEELPFVFVKDNCKLYKGILNFNGENYISELSKMEMKTGLVEDGDSSKKIVNILMKLKGKY